MYQQQLKLGQQTPPPPKKPLPIRNIAIFRIKYKPPEDAAAAAAASRKRKALAVTQDVEAAAAAQKQRCIVAMPGRGGKTHLRLSSIPCSVQETKEEETEEVVAAAVVEKKQKAPSAPREFEYVDIPKLYAGLSARMHAICPSVQRNAVHRCVFCFSMLRFFIQTP